MRATLANLSPIPRTRWTVLTVPRTSATEALPAECSFVLPDGRAFRAVRGRAVGQRIVFRVRAHLSGYEAVVGQLVGTRHGDAMKAPHFHPWVYDDLLEMVPQIGVAAAGGGYGSTAWSQHVDLQVVDQSPAHTRFKLTQRVPQYGLYHHCWVDVCHLDPVAQFWSRVTWSDRQDPAQSRFFDHLIFKAGEFPSFDFGRRHGIQAPQPDGRGWAALLNSASTPLVDGAALPITGRLLSFFSDPAVAPPPPDAMDHDFNLSLQDLAAGAYGDVYGLCHEWDGNWLALGRVARFDAGVDVRAIAEQHWQQHLQLQELQAGWYADRPFGLGRMPGMTGKQEDFGGTKGTPAVVGGDPRLIHAMMYSAHGDLLRGYLHHEADGRMVRADQHQQWVTWSRRTHFHPAVSIDRLGKTSTAPIPSQLYEGVDDEHMSNNYLAAYASLADDPMLEDSLRYVLETDRASYRRRFPNNGWGATRAQGRTSGAWAQLAMVADADTARGFAELITHRLVSSSVIPTLQVPGPMRVLAVGGPDPRKPIFDTAGNLTSWTSMWELGLAMVGLQQAMRAGHPDIDQIRGQQILTTLAETMARFAFFRQGETWRTVGDIMWNGGSPPPGGLTYPSPHVTSMERAPDVCSWTFAGVLVARDVLPTSHPLWASMNEYVLYITGGTEAKNLEAADWWAAARAIVV